MGEEIPPIDHNEILISLHQNACKRSEAAYALDSSDADNLTKWGMALLELSSLIPHQRAAMLTAAMSKLDEALRINPKNAETLWCMGKSLLNSAFMFNDADSEFSRATEYFRKACEEDPQNTLYRAFLLDYTSMARESHAGLYKSKSAPAATHEQLAKFNHKIWPYKSLSTQIAIKRRKALPTKADPLRFFKNICETAKAAYAIDPLDADNLLRWGDALLDLSWFVQPASEAKRMIQDAIYKLKEATLHKPENPKILWCLGSAHFALASYLADAEVAGQHFMKAGDYFKKACDEEPNNELYRISLEDAAKAPKLHAEFHKRVNARAAAATRSSSTKGESHEHGFVQQCGPATTQPSPFKKGFVQQSETATTEVSPLKKIAISRRKDLPSKADSIRTFTNICETAKAAYATDPLDADNFLRWGNALLDLSSFVQPDSEAKRMIQDAIYKLKEAILLKPENREILWCLGTAHFTLASYLSDPEVARQHFMKAGDYYNKARDKAPKLHAQAAATTRSSSTKGESHEHGFVQQCGPATTQPSLLEKGFVQQSETSRTGVSPLRKGGNVLLKVTLAVGVAAVVAGVLACLHRVICKAIEIKIFASILDS